MAVSDERYVGRPAEGIAAMPDFDTALKSQQKGVWSRSQTKLRKPPAQTRYASLPHALSVMSVIIPCVFLVVGLVFVSAPVNNLRTAYHAVWSDERDSWYPMLTAVRWLAAHPGQDLYQQIFFVSHIKFHYPLTSLVFIEWTSQMTFEEAMRLLNLMNLVFAMLCSGGAALLTVTLADQAGVPLDRRLRLHLAAAAAVATACFLPLVRGLELGQVQVVIDALFILACCAHARGLSALAGALVGLCVLIKPQLGLFLLWALAHRVWPFAIGWLVVVAIGYIASAILYGPRWPFDFANVMAYIGAHGEAFAPNQSVNGLVNRLLGNGDAITWHEHDFAPYNPVVHASSLLAALTFVAFGVGFGLRSTAGRGSLCAMIVAGACFTMSSPVVWDHHWGLVLPAFCFSFAALISREQGSPDVRRRWWVALAIAYFLLGNEIVPLNRLAGTWLSPLSSYMFFAGVAVTIMTGWLGRQAWRSANLRVSHELSPTGPVRCWKHHAGRQTL
jgi:alpha-1,2-mannosyltransferase